MTSENITDTSVNALGVTSLSDFFRHGSVEEKRAVYAAAARAAIAQQRQIMDAARANDQLHPDNS